MVAELKPTRPVLRYHGGKWILAEWILSHFPRHRIYVEPYAGAASVLLRKDRCFSEVYNDLNGEIVNLFTVLRDPAASAELRQLIEHTPFARAEFARSRRQSDLPVEQARRTLVRFWMGVSPHGAQGAGTGYRTGTKSAHRAPAQDWAKLPEQFPLWVERLRGVNIESAPALTIIRQNDTPQTLFYCDPPYPKSTRSKKTRPLSAYAHEMTDEQHRELAEGLRAVKGMVIVSGYPCDLYDSELYPDWHRVERDAFAEAGNVRTEVLWINEAAWQARLNNAPLFNTEQVA